MVFPDLDAATSGENDGDALFSARELLGCVMAGLEEDGEEIPVPTPLAKVTCEEHERVVLIDVYMLSIRMAQRSSAGEEHQLLPGVAGWTKTAIRRVT